MPCLLTPLSLSSVICRDTTDDRQRCVQHLANAIVFIRNVRSLKLCRAAQGHWGHCTSLALAQLADRHMSDEGVSAVVTRGASVLEEGGKSCSAEDNRGPGLYLQIVGGTRLPTMYVGKSDVSLRVRLQAWSYTVKKVKEGTYKGQPPLIARARNDPLATTFAAVALLALRSGPVVYRHPPDSDAVSKSSRGGALARFAQYSLLPPRGRIHRRHGDMSG